MDIKGIDAILLEIDDQDFAKRHDVKRLLKDACHQLKDTMLSHANIEKSHSELFTKLEKTREELLQKENAEAKTEDGPAWECKETGKCLPTELNILGMKYDVVLTEDYNILNIHGKLANGIVDNYQRKIWISTRMNYESMVHTLVHEVIHIIEWIYDRHNERTDLTEWQIDMIASGVMTLILNNDLSKITR